MDPAIGRPRWQGTSQSLPSRQRLALNRTVPGASGQRERAAELDGPGEVAVTRGSPDVRFVPRLGTTSGLAGARGGLVGIERDGGVVVRCDYTGCHKELAFEPGTDYLEAAKAQDWTYQHGLYGCPDHPPKRPWLA